MRTEWMYWTLTGWFIVQAICMYGFVHGKKVAEIVCAMLCMGLIAYALGWV